ncbi:MAG: MarR family transcriptional regulator [Archaeoglobi archaeon]|nr:MarR family transcriptional regulator [Candidatus Mnemosynella bozhongmuii]
MGEIEEKIMHSCSRISKKWGFGAPLGRILGLMLIESRPMTQSEIKRGSGYSKGLVSRTLAKMRELGMVEVERNGRELIYSLRFSLPSILSLMVERFLEEDIRPILENLSEIEWDGDRRRKLERMLKEYSALSTAIKSFSSILKEYL